MGGILGKNMAGSFDAPCRTKNIAREIPPVSWHQSSTVHMVIGGFLPFRYVSIVYELLFTMCISVVSLCTVSLCPLYYVIVSPILCHCVPSYCVIVSPILCHCVPPYCVIVSPILCHCVPPYCVIVSPILCHCVPLYCVIMFPILLLCPPILCHHVPYTMSLCPSILCHHVPYTMSLCPPYSAISVELYYIFATVWGREAYTLYGILFLVFVILISVTACISIALTKSS